MQRGRVLLAGILGATLVLGLSACEKPDPSATVFSGTTSKWKPATCWAPEGSTIDVDACAKEIVQSTSDGATLPAIPVAPGDTVGISVDPVVADAGWQPVINNESRSGGPVTSTYYRFTMPEQSSLPADGIVLQIIAGTSGNLRGVWLFRLVPAA